MPPIGSQIIKNWLIDFTKQVQSGNITFHNEASLLVNLVCFLRQILKSNPAYEGYKVDVEANIAQAVKCPNFKTRCGKRNIDVVIFHGDSIIDLSTSEDKYAIELKFPTNGQYPEQMFKFIQDIAFMEEAQGLGNTMQNASWFNGSFCLTFADDPNFYHQTGRKVSKSIYKYFRNCPNPPITGQIANPIANSNPKQLNIVRTYTVNWIPSSTSPNNTLKYY